jgi:hypothetical protein
VAKGLNLTEFGESRGVINAVNESGEIIENYADWEQEVSSRLKEKESAILASFDDEQKAAYQKWKDENSDQETTDYLK